MRRVMLEKCGTCRTSDRLLAVVETFRQASNRVAGNGRNACWSSKSNWALGPDCPRSRRCRSSTQRGRSSWLIRLMVLVDRTFKRI